MSASPFASFGTINAMPRAAETHPLTWRLRDDGAVVGLDEYRNKDGYEGARKALDMKADDIAGLVKEAGLKGRGGAGFPAGVKWSLTARGEEMPRGYVVCNADEMEPNTYKDRMLMEQLPHLLIEGMIISALANNSFRGYIFLRGEYVDAARSLEEALVEAREAGILGTHVLGSDFDFDIFLHTGAGRYICGEETALINSLEGRRANPRSKPPFPGQSGAWGKPTVVNNVETLCNAPSILANGKNWYLGLALEGSDDGGTKLFGFTGQVNNPGLWELPLGTTAREIFEDYAQGMKSGYQLKAWQPGGAGTGFLLPEHLSAQMCSNGIGEVGTRMGTGLSLAIDHTVSMVSLLRNMEEFFARESCGWCTPCRDGLPWTVRILRSLERGEGEQGDIEILEELTGKLGPGKTFCAHAPGAIEPLGSAIQYFRDEFEQGINHPKREAHGEPIPVGSV
ncbi:NADH-quinone oxidoreductase subunit NuoF [Larsenimonas rhizosphaerae]|uniref:NADH-quinone oxidoreductase subunit F n=1 Tax=Larsenimonas rhizosphaerae TaxID=2944682 RepID=A0AA42CUX9_9GAMM|nr:NADH-quinone oxidoreductase subunit NuoF [Larsenimonas rhizosphaerae]MCX2525127.1 NADH-quinone oxidoreductase subunit NuoF [Larsenimonas rhizosphaerae]